jgi:hypothetical protein
MEVLVLESEPGAADKATAQLEAAGHRIQRCHKPGARAFPCVGIDPGRCPLEQDPIDVVLTVRARPNLSPSASEDGVSCALRRHTPVVVAGRTTANPYAQYPVTVAGIDDVVAACERAVSGPQVEHESVATRVLDETLGHAGLASEAATASVHRTGEGLRITLLVPEETPRKVRDVASVRVTGAVRRFDPYAPRIEITCQTL